MKGPLDEELSQKAINTFREVGILVNIRHVGIYPYICILLNVGIASVPEKTTRLSGELTFSAASELFQR